MIYTASVLHNPFQHKGFSVFYPNHFHATFQVCNVIRGQLDLIGTDALDTVAIFALLSFAAVFRDGLPAVEDLHRSAWRATAGRAEAVWTGCVLFGWLHAFGVAVRTFHGISFRPLSHRSRRGGRLGVRTETLIRLRVLRQRLREIHQQRTGSGRYWP